VRELELTLTPEEYRSWIVFTSHEPLNVAEVQMAGLLHLVSSYMGNDCAPSDFMLSSHKSAVKDDANEGEPLTGKALENYIKGII